MEQVSSDHNADTVSSDSVRTQLTRILESPEFSSVPRRRKLLKFLVEETLDGRANLLKGYTVGISVFGRDEDFDANADPVVRIEAHRLRRDLDSYYMGSGRHDPVRIEIPKGGYVAAISDRSEETMPIAKEDGDTPETKPEQEGSAEPGKRFAKKWLLAGVALFLCVALTSLLWKPWKQPAVPVNPPGLAILPFEALSDTNDDRYFAQGLSVKLVDDLTPFNGVRIYTLPLGLTKTDIDSLQSDGRITYILTGLLRPATNHQNMNLIVHLKQLDGEIIWSESYEFKPAADAFSRMQDELSAVISTTLGQAYGVVANEVRDHFETAQRPTETTFACLMRAYDYRRTFAPEFREPIHQCLESAVIENPENPDAWAMLGFLRRDVAVFSGLDDQARRHFLDSAFDATKRAVDLSPNNVLALQAHAAVLHHRGNHQLAEDLMRQVIEISPNDPELLQQLGWRLAARGRLEEGVGLIRQAIELSIDPPARYHNLIAINDYLNSRYDDMLIAAQKSAAGGSGLGHGLLAIAIVKTTGASTVESDIALKRMAEIQPELEADPGAYFRRHGTKDDIADTLVSGLIEAGWSSP